MNFLKTGAALWVAVLLLEGCSSTGKAKGEGIDGFGTANANLELGKYQDGSGGAYGRGQHGADGGTAGQYGGKSPDSPGGLLSVRIVYFLYDSSEVQPQYLPVINNHASYLLANPGKTAVLEGHADERGSPEYNIALAEQRAQAVAKLMKLQGVADRQIQIVSFGEEKPQVPGHDDDAWQQNRRVEISYLVQ